MSTQHWKWFPIVALAGLLTDPGSAEGPAASLPDRVSVTLHAFATPIDGATQDVSSAAGGTGVYLLTGGFDAKGRPERVLCTSGVGTGEPSPDSVQQAVHVWRASFEVLEATMESITVRADWSRETAGRPGAHVRQAGDVRTVKLKEGETHTLDVLASDPADADECAASLRVDLRADVQEDEALADARIGYDIWLLDESRDGRPEHVHVRATGRQGEQVSFTFPELRYALEGIRFHDGRAAQVVAALKGQLRGRLRRDGSIDVYLSARRFLGVTAAEEKQTAGIGDGGAKTLRLKPREVLALSLPEPQGSHRLALDRQSQSTTRAPGMHPTAGGVEASKDSVTVDFGHFLADHKMSLRLTTRVE